MQLITKQSRWILNGGPSHCASCANPFPYDKDHLRIEAQVGQDGLLYCFGTTCADDAAVAAYLLKKRAS